MMRRFASIFFAACIIMTLSLITINCSDDSSVNPIAVDSSDFRFPFKDGCSWTYTLTTTATDIRPDSIRPYVESVYPYEISGTARILYDTIINSVMTKCFIDEFTFNGTLRKNRYYYINNDTSLILFQSRPQGPPSGLLPLKKIRGHAAPVLDLIYNSGSDSLTSTLKYPVATGTEWTIHVTSFPTNYDIIHKYLGFENVTTTAGVFSCMRELTTITLFPQLSYYNYYSSKGLMKTEWKYDDSPITTIKYPEGIGTADIITVLDILSFNIPQ